MVMKPTTSPLHAQVEQFWGGYYTLFQVPDGALPWYQKHIKAFINFCLILVWSTGIRNRL